jgi:hypothetical protein
MLIIVLLLFGLLLIAAFYRGEAIFICSMKTINEISDKAEEDIVNGRSWEWRYSKFAKCDALNTWHLFEFWKPVRSYFDGIHEEDK